MKNSAFSSRKFKYGSLSVAMTCVIIAAVLLLNGVFKLLADKYLWYTDLTRDEIYTLSDAAVEALENIDKDVHILFCDDPDNIENEYYSKMIYKTDHLAVVMPKDHPLAGSQSVTLQQLSGEHFILHSSHSSTPHNETRKFLELCQSQHFTPDIAAQSHLTSTMLHYVRNGKGIAVLNRMHMPYTDNDMAVIDISPTVRTYLYLMYPRRITAACAKAFLHFMVDYCNQ